MDIVNNHFNKTLSRQHRILILMLFLASGISYVIYEVVWIRQLTYFLGATIFSVSTVLAAYMGGMALGSWLGGYYADRYSKPLRAYAFLEVGIGMAAMLPPLMIGALDPFYSWIYKHFHASFLSFGFLNFAVNFALLMVPTTLMGATLPVLSRFLEREKQTIGLNAGALYASNTFGVVLGCLYAGFLGIPLMGLMGTIYFAIAINLCVGLTALRLSYQRDSCLSVDSSENQKRDCNVSAATFSYPSHLIIVFAVAYGFSGISAIGYQVIWMRSLPFSFAWNSNDSYSFIAILTVFLAGLSVGSALMSRLSIKSKDVLMVFSYIQLLIGLTAVLSLYMIAFVIPDFDLLNYINQNTGAVYWRAAIMNNFVKTAAAILLPTFLMGMSFPLAVKGCVPGLRNLGYGVGRVYAFNAIGAALGAFLSGFVLIPMLGITKALLVFAILNALIGIVLLVLNPYITARHRSLYAVIAVVIISIPFIYAQRNIVFLKLKEGQRLLFYEEGPLDTISVVQYWYGVRRLLVDRIEVAGTDPVMLTDQKTLAHLPMLLLKDPKSALVFGFGTGGTSWSFLRYQELNRLDVVEISPTILKTASLFEKSNHNILDNPRDPRLNIIIDDARNYLRMNNTSYDIIEVDVTDFSYKDNASLYTLEYFKLCKKRLTQDGMTVAWVPLRAVSEASFLTVLRTFSHVFPNTYIWYFNNYPTHYVLMLGANAPLNIDYQLMLKRLEYPQVDKDLAEISLNNPIKILSSFVTDQRYISQIAGGGMFNTEDYPYVEFYAPRSKYATGEKQLIDNLNLLMNGRQDIYPYLANIPYGKDKEVKAKLQKYSDALPHIIIGHNFGWENRHSDAREAYQTAIAINPEDASVYAQVWYGN